MACKLLSISSCLFAGQLCDHGRRARADATKPQRCEVCVSEIKEETVATLAYNNERLQVPRGMNGKYETEFLGNGEKIGTIFELVAKNRAFPSIL